MVYTPRNILLPVALALVVMQTQRVSATSLFYDPYTSSGTTNVISTKFPARGAEVTDEDCAITVEVDPTLPNITTISTVTVTYTEYLANTTTAPTEAVSTKVGTAVLSKSTPSADENQDAYTTVTTTTSSSTTTTATTTTSSSATTKATTTTSTSATMTATASGKIGTTVSPSSTTGSASTTSTALTTTTATPSEITTTTSAPATTTAAPSVKTGVTTTAPSTGSAVEGASDSEDPNCATGWETTSRKLRDSALTGRKLQEKIEKKRQLESNSNTDIAKLEAYFGTSMVTTLSELPTVAVHTPSPWPGPYWPTYQDSINVEWNEGQPSPAEKYATAFDLDVDDFMDKVSADNGIDSMSSHTTCTSDMDCSSLTDESSCAIRAGKSSGYCIPTWYGICHAWTPASMLEDEPNCAVTYNGVTFQPMDLKALLSDIYDGATVSTVFTGTRYNGGTDSTDEYGRHSSDAYRDLNPAYFHIAAANLLGNLNATFIADVTAGSEVWNQPVRGFQVYEQTEMTLEDAASTFYGLESYPYNSAATSIVYVKARLSWIFETYTDGGLVSSGEVDSYTTGAYYYYLLEMDDDGNIIGGEWVYDSDDDHPDFLWFPQAKPSTDTVTSIGLSYADVTMLLEKSVACEDFSSDSSDLTSSTALSGSEGVATTMPATIFSSASSTPDNFAEFTEAPSETPDATDDDTGSSTVTPDSTTATTWGYNDQGDDSSEQPGYNSFFNWW